MVRADELRKKLRQAQRALHQVRERYEIAMKAINESVYEWDLARDRFTYSDSMERVIGVPPELLKTMGDWQKRVHPADFPSFRAATVAHLKGATERLECDYRYRALDGTWRWARTRGAALRDKKGRALRIVGSTGDITELKRAEAALHAIEERYALATSVALEGIYEWDLEAGKLYLTERAKAFLSLPGEQLTPAAWNSRIHGDDYAGYRRAVLEHFKGRTPRIEHEYRIADGQGGYKWVLDHGIAVRNPAGRVTRVVGAVSDITRRKRAELESRQAREQAEEALEQQKASGEVLRVMSSSPGDIGPVFDTIISNAVRLGEATFGLLLRFDGQSVHIASHHNFRPEVEELFRKGYPQPPSRDNPVSHSILGREVKNVADILASDYSQAAKQRARVAGYRAVLSVPMMHNDVPVGAIGMARADPGLFPDSYVALVKTFAAQAVIAIDNVRLFNETTESLEQQKASGEVLSAISASLSDTKPVFDKILYSCQRLFAGKQVGINLVADDERIVIGAYQGPGREELERIAPFPPGHASGSGAAIAEGRVKHYPDAQNGADVPKITRRGCTAIGVKSVIFAPMLWEARGIGVIFVGREFAGPFSEKEIALLRTFADQAVIAIQNARLFREIQEKSAQLEVANKHKSDFLANMSHELRTPLNAIIGFSEVLGERMFGEVNEKQAEYLKDIHESGRHLLSLINDILDLSKIEAGRMDLELSSFDLPSAVSNAMTLIRERAQRHGIALGLDMDPRLGEFQADERKLKQILLNLLSNAVKFTPDGGRVDVTARAMDGRIEIAVHDTGIGINAEDQASLFEEFRQVGHDSGRKAEGTGLGLALTKRLVELHGGQIHVQSAIGQGSTFRVSLPLHA